MRASWYQHFYRTFYSFSHVTLFFAPHTCIIYYCHYRYIETIPFDMDAEKILLYRLIFFFLITTHLLIVVWQVNQLYPVCKQNYTLWLIITPICIQCTAANIQEQECSSAFIYLAKQILYKQTTFYIIPHHIQLYTFNIVKCRVQV